MKKTNEMNASELMTEIQSVVSIFDDYEMALHCAAHLAELAEALEQKAIERMTAIPA